MSVAVLIPWRTQDPARVEIWSWVLKRWQLRHPTFEVVTGTPAEGPWSKGAAVMDALRQTKADTLIVADADVWCDGIQAAVSAIEQKRTRWAMPHRTVKRLSPEATKSVLSGRMVLDRSTDLIENHIARRGGGVVVLPREVLEGVPMDPGFTGWGQEDESWAIALETLAGPVWQGETPLFHLWHPPAERQTRAIGSAESLARYRRYQEAAGNQEQMRNIISEFCKQPMEGYPMSKFTYRNKNTGQVVSYPRKVPRLEFLQNWERVEEGTTEQPQVTKAPGLLGSANVGDRQEERHKVPGGTFEPVVEVQPPGSTDTPEQSTETLADPVDRQPEVIEADAYRQVEPSVPSPLKTEPDPENRPAKSATKDQWVKWATECGADKQDAEAMTKAELIEIYGE